MIIAAEDLAAQGSRREATERLREFAEKCCWKNFKEIAENEARRHALPADEFADQMGGA